MKENRFKKVGLIALALLFIFTLLLAGCSGGQIGTSTLSDPSSTIVTVSPS